MSETQLPRNLGLELVRATEAAALSAGRWMGLGDPATADSAAAEAMYAALNEVAISGKIVMGEEYKPHHHTKLISGLQIGTGERIAVDLILDPIDGRSQLAKGYPGAISAAAIAARGTIWAPSPAIYMEKIVVDSQVAPYLVPECLDAPAAWTLALIARAKGCQVNALTVFVLDRPRHADLIAEIRAAGAHVMLRSDGDVSGALMVLSPRSGVDALMGTGGIPEGLLAACAVKALRGAMLGRLDPQSEAEREKILAAGCDPDQILARLMIW